MLRVLLKLMIPVVLLCAVCLVGAHAAVQRDDELMRIRAVLTECQPAPCFMGIRPGVTTVEEAIALLRKSPWVRDVTPLSALNTASPPPITWSWNGFQPIWINGFIAPHLEEQNDHISAIQIETFLSFADLWAMFGQPDKGSVRNILQVANTPQVAHFALYPDQGFLVRSEPLCPLQPESFWSASTRIVWGDNLYTYVQFEEYNLSRWYRSPSNCRR